MYSINRSLIVAIFILVVGYIGQASAQNSPNRPVLVLPGIVGSILEGPDDVYWGDAGALRRFNRLMVPGGPRDPDDALRPTALIDEIGVFGIPLADQYNLMRDAFEEVGFESNVTYFEYPYDWRQSNFTTAANLAIWIADHKILSDIEFDMVGHSMGGLISEIYVRRHDPNRKVRRLVTLGTPLKGAVRAAGVLDEGWGDLANLFAGGLRDIKSVVLSFPSVYELLPRYSNCCAVGTPGAVARSFDITTDSGWSLIDWQAATPPDPSRVKIALNSARLLRDLLATPLPIHLEVFRVVSTRFDTPQTFYIHPRSRKIETIVHGPGDGVVSTFSAAGSRRQIVDITSAKHQTIFDDDGFVGALQVVFTDVVAPPVRVSDQAFSVVTRKGKIVKLRTIGVHPEKSITNVNTSVSIEIQFAADGDEPLESLEVSLVPPSGEPIDAQLVVDSLRFDAFAGRNGLTHARFIGTLPGVETEGALRFAVHVGNDVVAKDAYIVIDIEKGKRQGN